MGTWKSIRDEVREMVWLASLVGALSVLGVGLAVMLALAADTWQSWSSALTVLS